MGDVCNVVMLVASMPAFPFSLASLDSFPPGEAKGAARQRFLGEVFWMRRSKRWLIDRVLPVWAREELLRQIRELEKENERLRNVVALKQEYIDGLKWGVRAQRKAVVEEGKR